MYAFEITCISSLPNAGLAVFDGNLIEGCVATDSIASLVHGNHHFPIHVKGIIFDFTKNRCLVMSLTAELDQEAVTIAVVGDRLVCT
jgi:hypothetical protein